MNVIVETTDLRRALRAVTPHAHPAKELSQLHRIRLTLDGQNVTVTATNQVSVAAGLVSVWEHGDGELGYVDLSPSDVKQILAVFPAANKTKDTEAGPDETLRIEVIEENTTVTDISGLFPGKSLQLPRYPDDSNFPDLRSVLAKRLTMSAKRPTERLFTSGPYVDLFAKAAAVYAKPLVFDVPDDKGTLLVTCGESFLGMLIPGRPDEEAKAEVKGWHSDWLNRWSDALPGIAS